jgi:hypothetical protein
VRLDERETDRYFDRHADEQTERDQYADGCQRSDKHAAFWSA